MFQIILIGLSLAMDAFAISVTNSMTVSEYKPRHAFLMGAYFGAFQFLMPLVGSLLAGTVSSHVERFGPYVSFVLLAFIGGRMLHGALKGRGAQEDVKPVKLSHGRLLALAVATSIDALAVGVSFAFMEISIIQSCLIIGIVTFIVCVFGAFVGKKIQWLTGWKAELFGGIVLVAIGIKLLLEGIL